MKKVSVFLFALCLALAACSPAAELPTSVAATGAASTSAPAITAQEGTLVFSTAMPAATTSAGSTAVANSTAAATIGGPVVITVMPANGTPEPAITAPAPTPIPTLPSGLSPTEIKFHVLAAFPNLFFCDPDYYPVARADEADLAQQRFPELQANQEEFQAILNHNNMSGQATFSADQKLLIYREHKKLAAIHFELKGDKYQFQLQTKDTSGQGQLITGLIDGQGTISAQQSQPSFATCPICLAAQTQIDTPRGPVAVINLRPGDLVWTVDAAGARVAAPILQTGHVPVPAAHQMVHVTLDDGRQLLASPGHPTADGRALGQLALGDQLDGARIGHLERVIYGQPFTYDLLPAGATGFYWANGILMGSTLK
jgi:hypothetical protein